MQQLMTLNTLELFVDLDQSVVTLIERSKFKRIVNQEIGKLQKSRRDHSESPQLRLHIENSASDEKAIEEVDIQMYNNEVLLKKVEEAMDYPILKEQYDLEIECIKHIDKCINGETTKFTNERWIECVDDVTYNKIIRRLLLSKENHQERAQRLCVIMANTDRDIALPIKMMPIKKMNPSKEFKKVSIDEKYNIYIENEIDKELKIQRQEAFLRNQKLEKEKEMKDSSLWICPQCKGKNNKEYSFLCNNDMEWCFLQCRVCSSRHDITYKRLKIKVQSPKLNSTISINPIQYEQPTTPSSPTSHTVLHKNSRPSVQTIEPQQCQNGDVLLIPHHLSESPSEGLKLSTKTKRQKHNGSETPFGMLRNDDCKANCLSSTNEMIESYSQSLPTHKVSSSIQFFTSEEMTSSTSLSRSVDHIEVSHQNVEMVHTIDNSLTENIPMVTDCELEFATSQLSIEHTELTHSEQIEMNSDYPKSEVVLVRRAPFLVYMEDESHTSTTSSPTQFMHNDQPTKINSCSPESESVLCQTVESSTLNIKSVDHDNFNEQEVEQSILSCNTELDAESPNVDNVKEHSSFIHLMTSLPQPVDKKQNCSPTLPISTVASPYRKEIIDAAALSLTKSHDVVQRNESDSSSKWLDEWDKLYFEESIARIKQNYASFLKRTDKIIARFEELDKSTTSLTQESVQDWTTDNRNSYGYYEPGWPASLPPPKQCSSPEKIIRRQSPPPPPLVIKPSTSQLETYDWLTHKTEFSAENDFHEEHKFQNPSSLQFPPGYRLPYQSPLSSETIRKHAKASSPLPQKITEPTVRDTHGHGQSLLPFQIEFSKSSSSSSLEMLNSVCNCLMSTVSMPVLSTFSSYLIMLPTKSSERFNVVKIIHNGTYRNGYSSTKPSQLLSNKAQRNELRWS